MTSPSWRIREIGIGIEVPLHVLPRARRNEIAGTHDGALKLKISAPPVDDAANRAVINFFATLLDLPRSRLSIISGAKSREKVLRIESISASDFFRHLPAI
jgi:uncharacterized protein